MDSFSGVIKASAGTGKTHTLVRHYLASLVSSEIKNDPLRRNLAITFTRAASFEIKNRLISLLLDISKNKKSHKEFLKDYKVNTTQDEFCEYLFFVLKNIDLLNIQTIDSFLNQCAHIGSRDMGLPFGWKLMIDQSDINEFSEEVFGVFLDTMGGRCDISAHLRDFEESKSVISLDNFIKAIKNAYDIEQTSNGVVWEYPTIKKFKRGYNLKQIKCQLLGSGFYTTKIRNEIDLFENGHWKHFLSGGIARSIFLSMGAVVCFYNKKEIPKEIVDSYRLLIEEAMVHISNIFCNKTKRQKELARDYFKTRRLLQQSKPHFDFKEICWMLKTASGLNILDNLYLLNDAKTDRIFIDEFQDTSALQFSVLKPMLDELVFSKENSRGFLVVGDNKQSIYGWRGGEPAVFDFVMEKFKNHGVKTQSLLTNYRSSKTIVDFVNGFFSTTALRAQNIFKDEGASHLLKVFDDWDCEYEPIRVSPKNKMFGCVRFFVSDSKSDADIIERSIDEVVKYKDFGGVGSIAVLLRSNKYLGDLSARLNKHGFSTQGGEGKSPLTDSKGVLLLVSLLRAIEFPGDTSSRTHIINSPLSSLFNNNGSRNSLDVIRQKIEDVGLTKTLIGVLYPAFKYFDEHDFNRIEQSLKHAETIYNKKRRLSDVVSVITNTRDVNPSGADVVVMTIHQSKGLDFNFVVLPVFQREYFYKPRSVAVKRNAFGLPDSVTSWPTKSLDPALKQYSKIRHADELRQCKETLCLQYVSMTRAKHGMSLIVPKSSKKQSKTVGCFIRSYFLKEAEQEDNGLVWSVENKGLIAKNKKPSSGLSCKRIISDVEKIIDSS